MNANYESAPQAPATYKAHETQLAHMTWLSPAAIELRASQIESMVSNCRQRHDLLVAELQGLAASESLRAIFLKDQIDICRRWLGWSQRDLDRLRGQIVTNRSEAG